MANNNQRFGSVPDEQQDYWRRGYAARDGQLLDNHFEHRSRGQRSITGQDSGISAYSIPRSQKVALREQPFGGIPAITGGDFAWDERYLNAQNRFAQTNGQIPNNLPDPYQGQVPDRVREVDAGAILAAKMMNSSVAPSRAQQQLSQGYSLPDMLPAQQAQQQHGPQPGYAMNNPQPSGPQSCQLIEGHTFYSQLQIQGFGTTMSIVKTGGTIKGVQGRQFVIKGVSPCYIVDGLSTIDLQHMEPQRQKQLVRVEAPLLGVFLVPQSAIAMEGNQPQQGRQMLIDQNQGQNIAQRQQWNQQASSNQGQQLLISQGNARQHQQQVQQGYQQQQQQQYREQVPQQQDVRQIGVNLLKRRGLLRG